ncbi:hypothetical protein BZM27_38010 [Paraburkholderia steynii]|uniref:Uncharacterized protein n=1 Tax=Paraburkholderia steynii TaxID=1245441 RepID=A0A4R0XCS2_9BURK|nr:hypothetical protein BZM27_38010 [Paraburkholderia steynii]
MSAVEKEDDGELPHVDVAMSIEAIATGQVLFSQNRRIEAMEAEPMTIERALNPCAREARELIEGRRPS